MQRSHRVESDYTRPLARGGRSGSKAIAWKKASTSSRLAGAQLPRRAAGSTLDWHFLRPHWPDARVEPWGFNWVQARGREPEGWVDPAQAWASGGTPEVGELLANGEVFEGKVSTGARGNMVRWRMMLSNECRPNEVPRSPTETWRCGRAVGEPQAQWWWQLSPCSWRRCLPLGASTGSRAPAGCRGCRSLLRLDRYRRHLHRPRSDGLLPTPGSSGGGPVAHPGLAP